MKSLMRLLATLLVLVPIGFGPALVPVLRAVHEMGHTCACGMTPGKCGCPACARLEKERQRAQAVVPVLKPTCEDDGTILPAAPLPLCALQGEVVSPHALDEASISVRPTLHPKVRGAEGPPTPPPRRSAEVPQLS
ncbi:MAG: hypothetical protein ACRENE_24970 [Polyangiaceae bacterium]